jgi:hypothetical protein
MGRFTRSVRIATVVVGFAAVTSACAQLSEEDQALLQQAKTDAAAAQAAADRAADAADRAAAAASEAEDAASSARLAMERQERMTQQSLRK